MLVVIGHRRRRRGDFGEGVHTERVLLRFGVALALLGDHMKQLGAAEFFDVAENLHQAGGVVAVDEADVVETYLLEQGAGGHHALHIFLSPMSRFQGRGDLGQHPFAAGADEVVGPAGPHPREITGEAAHIVGDGHIVVVEDDEDVLIHIAGVVESLEGHPRGHGAVSDDGDVVALLLLHPRRRHHAEGGADGGAGMADAEGVVFAFAAFGEGGQPVRLPHGEHTLAAAGEDLVGVGLMAHIPDQPVVGGVEHIVEGDGEFHHAEAGAEMAAGLTHAVEQVEAQFVRQLGELGRLQPAQVGGGLDLIQQGGFGAV